MIKSKNIFLDNELKSGGFYELAIQVCPSSNNDPIKLYTDFIWSLNNVEGPFDKNFNLIKSEIKNIQHNGILNLGNTLIPFLTYNIREDEPIETGYNWFDICFYSSAIENIFGAEFQTWTENPNVPKEITIFFNSVLRQLYQIYPFELSIISFEVSGQYYLEDLKNGEIENPFNSKFYVGENNYEKVYLENRKYVTKLYTT